MTPVEIQAGYKRTEQRLQRQELHGGIGLAQAIRAPKVVSALDADAHPDVDRPGQARCEFEQPIGSLRQHLISVAGCVGHYREHVADERERHLLVEEVAH